MAKIYKYAILLRDSNNKPSKFLSSHFTLESAKKKLQNLKLPRASKGADIVSISKYFKD